MAKWYGCAEEDTAAQERLSNAWPDAPLVNLETCGYILGIARDQVWAYAPESESEDDDGEPVVVPGAASTAVPDNLVYAQLKQAENLWNAGRVNSAGDVGIDGYSYTPRPLDKTIRGMIRPIQGVFSVG